MFKGILITKDECRLPGRGPGYRRCRAAGRRRHRARRVVHAQLQGRPGASPASRRSCGAFPMVPGIDFAGTVSESSQPGLEGRRPRGAQRLGRRRNALGRAGAGARVQGDWLVPLPAAFTARQAMAIGTAGYTAMLCVLALERHGVKPADGEILVTGATGGVGSVAIALLSKLGYRWSRHRPRRRSRLPEGAGRERRHRPQRTRGAGQAARQGALGRRRRCRRQPHAGQRLRHDQVSRRRRRLRAGRRHGFPGDGGALHPARRDAVRHRQRHGAAGGASGGLGAAGAGSRHRQARRHHDTKSACREAIATGARLLEGKVRGRVVVDISR